MKLRYMIALLLAGVLLTVLAGCNGSTLGLNPDVTFTLPTDTTVPTLPAGSLLQITGDATTVGTGDRIIKYQWEQQIDEENVAGVFSITDGPDTTWRAPATWTTPGELPVTLAFTVDTLQGGHTVKYLHLRITP